VGIFDTAVKPPAANDVDNYDSRSSTEPIQSKRLDNIQHDIQAKFKTQNGPKHLDKVDWGSTYPALGAHKPKYGIIIYRVPLMDLNFNSELTRGELTIVDVEPLHRNAKTTEHQSIIVFTKDPTKQTEISITVFPLLPIYTQLNAMRPNSP
jgi:hypothetical protein